MGKSIENRDREGALGKVSSSSSSSDFEFTVSLSPSSRRSSAHLCPADELFYKGQLLPLHLSPRISMVRTLLLSSSSTSSSSTTSSRDSNGSSSSSSCGPSDLFHLLPECDDSSRPSSVTEEEVKRAISSMPAKRSRYFSSFANRFSSVFLNRGGSKKDPSLALDLDFGIADPHHLPASASGKKTSSNSSAKQVIRKCVKKVKPLYDKFSSSQKNQNQNNQQQQPQPQQQQKPKKEKKKTFSFSIRRERDITLSNSNIVDSMKRLEDEEEEVSGGNNTTRGFYLISHSHSHSFSGNLRFPRMRKRCAGSCPSSMMSSPTHSGLLRICGGGPCGFPGNHVNLASSSSSSSSMEELQSAIQGAIAHCKSTMMQK